MASDHTARVNEKCPDDRMWLNYIVSSVISDKMKVGAWHGSLERLRTRYTAFFGDELRFLIFETEPNMYIFVEKGFHQQFKDERIRTTCEMYPKSMMGKAISYLTSKCDKVTFDPNVAPCVNIMLHQAVVKETNIPSSVMRGSPDHSASWIFVVSSPIEDKILVSSWNGSLAHLRGKHVTCFGNELRFLIFETRPGEDVEIEREFHQRFDAKMISTSRGMYPNDMMDVAVSYLTTKCEKVSFDFNAVPSVDKMLHLCRRPGAFRGADVMRKTDDKLHSPRGSTMTREADHRRGPLMEHLEGLIEITGNVKDAVWFSPELRGSILKVLASRSIKYDADQLLPCIKVIVMRQGMQWWRDKKDLPDTRRTKGYTTRRNVGLGVRMVM